MTLGHPVDVSDYTMTQNDGKRISVQRSYLERDLGIMIDSELNFSEHIHMVSKKANGIMAVIKRTFTCLDCECFNLLYKSLVRTHLEYGVTTWFPYKMKDILLLVCVSFTIIGNWTLKLLKKFRNEPQNRISKSCKFELL